MSNVKTFGHFLYESGARGTKGRYNPDSKITPSCPVVDGWERGTFNPDGVTFKDRYGFSLEETNGSPVGESIGATGAFADIVHDLSNPFMILDNQHYVVSTYWDVLDARYVMVGEQTAYAILILPIIQRVIGAGGGHENEKPDPCASVRALLTATKGELDVVTARLTHIQDIVDDLSVPARGGGVAWNAVRKIKEVFG